MIYVCDKYICIYMIMICKYCIYGVCVYIYIGGCRYAWCWMATNGHRKGRPIYL